MDANGTRFHLLLGPQDWGACRLDSPGRPIHLAEAWALAAGKPVTNWDPTELEQALYDQAVPDWDEMRSELTLRALVFKFNSAPGDQPPRLENRRGAGGDIFGNLYWIADEETSIQVRSAGSGNIAPFWSVGDAIQGQEEPPTAGIFHVQGGAAAPLRLRGLAVTRDHYLVVGVVDPAGLLVFDLHGGGPPLQLTWPVPPAGETAFQPYDIASRPDGGVWILDRASVAPSIARLWALDRSMNVQVLGVSSLPGSLETPDFQPIEGQPEERGEACPTDAPLSYAMAVVVRSGTTESVGSLVAIEALNDNSALLLDNAGDGETPLFAVLLRFSPQGIPVGDPLRTRVLTDRVDEDIRRYFSLLGYDFAFLPASQDVIAAVDEPERIWGTLLILGQDGNQAYAFTIAQPETSFQAEDGSAPLILRARGDYLPMRLFGGRGLIAGPDRAYYDSGRPLVAWLALVEQKRPRYEEETIFLTPLEDPGEERQQGRQPAFDSGEPDCTWHRLMIDACIPPDSQVEIWSRAANTEFELSGASWQSEPNLIRRVTGSELPYLRQSVGRAETGAATWELLFQRAVGRYLQLKIRLSGNGRTTPRLQALRAYYPRFSYLVHYLPAAYRRDPTSASFLDRFLANLEGIFTSLEDRIANVQALLDVRTAPPETLDWLASWFGLVLDPNWEEDRRRLLLAHAPELFRRRGTLRGMIQAIRLATDQKASEAIFVGDGCGTESASCTGATGTVRIVERFLTRRAPALIFGDPTQAEGPGLTSEVSEWSPQKGSGPLYEQYRLFLEAQYSTIEALNAAWGTSFSTFEQIELPPTRPAVTRQAGDWETFLRAGLGFTYTPVGPEDLQDYRLSLARLYGQIHVLNDAYERTGSNRYTGFDNIPLPARLPDHPRELEDWIEFVSIVVPTLRNAHRFSVLIPTTTGVQSQGSALAERVRQVVELEKPAHTTFDIKEFWALFRVGEARLGLDTLIDQGSRLAPLILSSSPTASMGSYLSQGYLNYSHPWQEKSRSVLGRDRLEHGSTQSGGIYE